MVANWDPTKPENDGAFASQPVRENLEAIQLGTDPALLVTNAKVASDAAILLSKLSTGSTDEELDDFLVGYKYGAQLSYSGVITIAVSAGSLMIGTSKRIRKRGATTIDLDNDMNGVQVKAPSTWYMVYATADASAATYNLTICADGTTPAGVTNYLLLGWFKTNTLLNIYDWQSIGNAGQGSVSLYRIKGPVSDQEITSVSPTYTKISNMEFAIHTENGATGILSAHFNGINDSGGAPGVEGIFMKVNAGAQDAVLHGFVEGEIGGGLHRFAWSQSYPLILSAGIHVLTPYVAVEGAGNKFTAESNKCSMSLTLWEA